MNKVLILLNMEYVYHIVTIRVNETSWAHVWRLRSRYLRMGYDTVPTFLMELWWNFSPYLGRLKDGTFRLCVSYLASF
jgi:hypothetical protein